ncbi:MAG: NAD(P)H-quinone oxidoreductase [Candidatus Latescibacterota bacterium]|nr:NAD(P)H-quinone oxidoreductase [Candidatus Latescibacterota bacterium]MEE2725843.1 NAD(P)H-quinone oxidoreductase [Candidatus Latescibacterota bacterium]
MRAIVVDGDERLHWQEVEDPTCAAHQVIVDVHASAVNRADLLQRAGHYPPPPGAPPYMGLEMCGTIRQTGDQVCGWNVGDRVLALLSGGGYAEQVAVPADHLIALPDDWGFARGAAVPEVFLTAFVNLFLEARLQPGETVLIHGGGSGVGTAAIQLARVSNCRVIATAGTDAKTARCQALGAELTINYRKRDFAEAALAHFDGVDVILDISAADYLERNIRLLNPMGRLVFIALLSGTHAPLDMGQVLGKRLRLIGSTLRNRTDAEKTTITRTFIERFWQPVEEGVIEPVIDTVWPIEQVEEAQQMLAQNKNIGKVILAVRKGGERL